MKIFTEILLILWQAPQSLIGAIMYPFMKNKVLVGKFDHSRCYMAENMSGGISFGPLSYISHYQHILHPESIKHEAVGHATQSRRWGPLYLIVIGLPSLVHAIFHNPYKSCYYDFVTEANANKIAGLGVDENCNLIEL